MSNKMLNTNFVREDNGFTNVGYLSVGKFKELLLNRVDKLLTGEAEGCITSDGVINHEVNQLLQGIDILREKVKSENI